MGTRASPMEQGPLQIHHGHTDTHVLMRFSRQTDHVMLTPEEADAIVRAIGNSQRSLKAHQELLAQKAS